MVALRNGRALTALWTVCLVAAWAVADPATQPAGKDKPQAAKPAPASGNAEPAPSKQPTTKKREPAVKEKVELKAEAAAKEAQPRIAHIRLEGLVLASPPDFSWFADETPGMTLREWVQRLAKARNDEEVQAVALETDSAMMSWAAAQELADAVRRLNEVKPVYAHVTDGGAIQYLVASAGKELTMDPSGTLMITGLGAEMMFFRGTLEWLGIRPQMIQIGRYKGASEPFMRSQPSDELKGEYDRLLDDLYDQLCQQIAQQRKLTVPHVQQAIDVGPHDAAAAKEYKLVDRLVGRLDWQAYVMQKVASGKKAKGARWLADYEAKKPKPLDFSNPLAMVGMMFGGRPQERTQDPTIAIIHADGLIVPGKGGEGFFGERRVGDRTMAACFERAAEDDKIKAVIFRIDSPGGSALASEMIYQSARKCAAKKPVIVSIASMGASGGYYIALGGQKILADPAAITGSIGVLSGKLAISGLLDKVGISTYEVTRGRNAGLWMSRAWDAREEQVIRKMAQKTYDVFTSRVKESRGGRIKDVEEVAQGRIFTARQAAKNGLIDEIGGLREAVIAAQQAAKIERSYFLILPRPKTIMDVLYGSQTAAPPLGMAGGLLGGLAGEGPALLLGHPRQRAGAAYLLSLGQLLGREPVLTALPCHLSVEP